MINMSCSGGHLGFLVNNKKLLKTIQGRFQQSVISQYLKIISSRVILLWSSLLQVVCLNLLCCLLPFSLNNIYFTKFQHTIIQIYTYNVQWEREKKLPILSTTHIESWETTNQPCFKHGLVISTNSIVRCKSSYHFAPMEVLFH